MYYSRKTHFNEMLSEDNQTVITRSQTQRLQIQKIVTYGCVKFQNCGSSACFSKIHLHLPKSC